MTATDRLYLSAQRSFAAWCHGQSISEPATHCDIARYLEECRTARGPSTVPVQLSAIAELYRENGYNLDTKNSTIQGVVAVARQQMRERRVTIRDFEFELRDLINQAEDDGLLPELVRDVLIAEAYAIKIPIRLPPPEVTE